MQLYLIVAETVLFLTSFALHNTPPIQATNAPFHFICVQYFSHNEHHVPVGVGAPPLGTQLLLNPLFQKLEYGRGWVYCRLWTSVHSSQSVWSTGRLYMLKFYMCGRSTEVTFGK